MISKLSRDQKIMLTVLALINFVNYVDRQIIFPLFPLIKNEFKISDFRLGLLGTMFMLVHSLSSLPLGALADKYSRKTIISIGIAFWSITSFVSGLARSFHQLLGIRSLVGIGEASYGPAATVMITDNFPKSTRSQAQGIFNVGMFVGSTVGTVLGGLIAFHFASWRIAFFFVSLPGILLAYFSWKLKDLKLSHGDSFIPAKALVKNSAYLWLILSGVLVTFATAAYISWGVTFATRYLDFNLQQASLILGILLLIAGLIGIVLGSKLADYFHEKVAWGAGMVIAVSLIITSPFIFIALAATSNKILSLTGFFIGTMFFSFYHGPITVVLHDIVPKHLRATAFAGYMLVIHLLGSTLAPALVGRVSDAYNLRLGLELSTVLVLIGGLTFLPVVWLIAKQKVLVHNN